MSFLPARTLANLDPRRGPSIKTLCRTELRMFSREPLALFWGGVFPIVLLVIIGASASSAPQAKYGGLNFISVYVPTLMVFVFGIVGLQAMPAILVSYRDKGYLRRLSTTPIGAGRLIQAQWMIYTGLCVISAVVIAVVGKFAFKAHFPSQFLGFLIILFLTAMAMLSLGTLVAAIARTPRYSQLLGLLFFYPMMFFAGLFGTPEQSQGHTLQTIGHCTPLGAAVNGLTRTLAGQWPPGWCYLCLIAWTLVIGRLAVRLFRWE